MIPSLTVDGGRGWQRIERSAALGSGAAWVVTTNFSIPFGGKSTWYDTNVAEVKERYYRAVSTNLTGMVWISPGSFIMGSPAGEPGRQADEGPATEVTLSRGFWMGQEEVTQGEYRAVMGDNPSWFTGDDRLPVEMVSWQEATNYCWKLTLQERNAGRIGAGQEYRLPTEAQWEYACRAGTTTRFSFGDDPGYLQLGNYAWYDSNSGCTTHPVGQKQPNAWGSYDMQGNVWEWCLDWYGIYPGGSVTDPRGPNTGSNRVIRGGGWDGFGGGCRSAYHYSVWPDSWYYDFGFRVVLAPGP